MKVQNPKSNFYSLPLSKIEGEGLNYVVVQVSARRYVVAEYSHYYQNSLGFVIVTDPMNYQDAHNTAQRLKFERLHKNENV